MPPFTHIKPAQLYAGKEQYYKGNPPRQSAGGGEDAPGKENDPAKVLAGLTTNRKSRIESGKLKDGPRQGIAGANHQKKDCNGTITKLLCHLWRNYQVIWLHGQHTAHGCKVMKEVM